MSKNQLTLVGFANTGIENAATNAAGIDAPRTGSATRGTNAKAKSSAPKQHITPEVVLFDRAVVTAWADELFHLDPTTREIGRTGVAAHG